MTWLQWGKTAYKKISHLIYTCIIIMFSFIKHWSGIMIWWLKIAINIFQPQKVCSMSPLRRPGLLRLLKGKPQLFQEPVPSHQLQWHPALHMNLSQSFQKLLKQMKWTKWCCRPQCQSWCLSQRYSFNSLIPGRFEWNLDKYFSSQFQWLMAEVSLQ